MSENAIWVCFALGDAMIVAAAMLAVCGELCERRRLRAEARAKQRREEWLQRLFSFPDRGTAKDRSK